MRREDLLDLNDILQHPGRHLTVEISTELETEEDIDLVTPLEGELDAVSTGNLLLLTGHFATKAIVECSRCGEASPVDVDFEVEEQFPVVGMPSSLHPQDMAKVSDEEPYPLFDGNFLMVEALLRQDFLISMPMQVICSACAAGTPVESGKSLQQEHVFDTLAKLKSKLEEKG